MLQRGHLEIQLIIQGAGAEQAVFLEIRHARQDDAAAEHDACAIRGRFQEGDGAAIRFAGSGNGEARGLDQAIDSDFKIIVVEDGKGEGEDALRAIGDVLRAWRHIADGDVFGHCGSLRIEGRGGPGSVKQVARNCTEGLRSTHKTLEITI